MKRAILLVLVMTFPLGCGGGGGSGGGGGGSGGGGGGGGGGGPPSPPSSLVYVENTNPAGPIAGFLHDDEAGINVYALAHRDSGGAPLMATGAMYEDRTGASWTVFFGPDGLPSQLVAAGFVVRFFDYTASTVAVELTDPSGAVDVVTDVAMDPAVIARLLSFAASGDAGAYPGDSLNAQSVRADPATGLFGMPRGRLLEIVGFGISAATCAYKTYRGVLVGGAIGGPIGGAVGAAMALWGCKGIVLKTINLFTESEVLDSVIQATTVNSCIGIVADLENGLLGCAGLVFSRWSTVVKDADTALKTYEASGTANTPEAQQFKGYAVDYMYRAYFGHWNVVSFTIRLPDGTVVPNFEGSTFTNSNVNEWNGHADFGQADIDLEPPQYPWTKGDSDFYMYFQYGSTDFDSVETFSTISWRFKDGRIEAGNGNTASYSLEMVGLNLVWKFTSNGAREEYVFAR